MRIQSVPFCSILVCKNFILIYQQSVFTNTGPSQAGGPGGGGGTCPPLFGGSVNPISTRGAHSPHIVLRAPSDFQTLRRSCNICSKYHKCSPEIGHDNYFEIDCISYLESMPQIVNAKTALRTTVYQSQ